MLSPMMQCGGRIRVKGCQFGTGDGSTRNFQLVDRHGHPVTKDVHVLAMHQTDWQGRVALSSQPRTNYAVSAPNWASSIQGSTGTPPVITPAYALGPDGSMSAARVQGTTVGATGSDGWLIRLMAPGQNAGSPGGSYGVWMRTTDGVSTVNIALRGFQVTLFVVVTGQWQFFSATGPGGADLTPPSITQRNSYPNQNNRAVDLLVAFPQVAESPQTLGTYIATTSAPVTVTDYAVDSSGDVTLGQPTATAGTLDWDGTARRAA